MILTEASMRLVSRHIKLSKEMIILKPMQPADGTYVIGKIVNGKTARLLDARIVFETISAEEVGNL